MYRKSTLLFIVAALILVTSGCVNEASDGATRTFTFALWVPLCVLVGGLIAGTVGWFFRESMGNLGWAFLIVGPACSMFLAPSLLQTRTIVSDTSFSQRAGVFGLTAVHDVSYEDLKKVRITSKVTRRKGRKRTTFYFNCERKDGTTVVVPVNNKVSEAAAPYFLKRVSELGIPIVDKMQGGN